nr:proline-rich protein 25 [Macaca fascicularis]
MVCFGLCPSPLLHSNIPGSLATTVSASGPKDLPAPRPTGRPVSPGWPLRAWMGHATAHRGSWDPQCRGWCRCCFQAWGTHVDGTVFQIGLASGFGRAQRDTRMAQTDQKAPCRGGCWRQPGHPNTGGAPACPTSHPMGHRPRMRILPCGDQTTGGQALSRETGLGPWAAGTHFLAISTTTWGRKMPAWISELLNSSGTAQSLNAVCEAQTIPGPGLRPQGTPTTRAPSHKATPSTPNHWGPKQPKNRHMHPKKGVSGVDAPIWGPCVSSQVGRSPGHLVLGPRALLAEASRCAGSVLEASHRPPWILHPCGSTQVPAPTDFSHSVGSREPLSSPDQSLDV